MHVTQCILNCPTTLIRQNKQTRILIIFVKTFAIRQRQEKMMEGVHDIIP